MPFSNRPKTEGLKKRPWRSREKCLGAANKQRAKNQEDKPCQWPEDLQVRGPVFHYRSCFLFEVPYPGSSASRCCSGPAERTEARDGALKSKRRPAPLFAPHQYHQAHCQKLMCLMLPKFNCLTCRPAFTVQRNPIVQHSHLPDSVASHLACRALIDAETRQLSEQESTVYIQCHKRGRSYMETRGRANIVKLANGKLYSTPKKDAPVSIARKMSNRDAQSRSRTPARFLRV